MLSSCHVAYPEPQAPMCPCTLCIHVPMFPRVHAPMCPCRYKEYISCGKGRDMGFDSINGFNSKIAGGGGEWAISRESYRMGTRLDIFRLFAFYHAAVGFYINSLMT